MDRRANKELTPEQRLKELDRIFSDPRMRRPWESASYPVPSGKRIPKLTPEQTIAELDKIFSDPRIRRGF